MATKISQVFHDIKTYASQKWEQFVTYFKNRKVAKLAAAEKKLPEVYDEPPTPPIPISRRNTTVSEDVTPVVNPPEQTVPENSVLPEADQKQRMAQYAPGGKIFKQVIHRAGINPEKLNDNGLLADYADAVMSHFPLKPGENLDVLMQTELFRLVQNLKTGKAVNPNTPIPTSSPSTSAASGSKQQEETKTPWVTFDEETAVSQPVTTFDHSVFTTPEAVTSPIVNKDSWVKFEEAVPAPQPFLTVSNSPSGREKIKTPAPPPPPPVKSELNKQSDKLPRQSSSQDDWVEAGAQTTIQASQPKEVEKKKLAEGQVEYHPFDKTMPIPIAGINWLHLNRYYNRIEFDEVADEMIQQSGEAARRYAGKSGHVANTIHIMCRARNWDGLMAYAHNIRDNQIVCFDPKITAEINMRLFQKSLISALESNMTRYPNRAGAYREAIRHASATPPEWNSLATNFLLNTEEFGADYAPAYCFERLERVIPEYQVPRPKLPDQPAFSPMSREESYQSPQANFDAFGQSVPAHISVTEVARTVVPPPFLTGDKGAAYHRVQQGIMSNDFYSVAEGITYLVEDQGLRVTDPKTYRAVRYRMIKERAIAQIGEKLSREASADTQEALRLALRHMEQDQWSKLGAIDRAYYQKEGNGLFSSYLMGEIDQYNRRSNAN